MLCSKYTKALGTRIQEIIIRLPDWRKYSKSKDHRKWFQEYGKQIAFEKIINFEKEKKETERDRNNENINKIMGTENEDYFMKVGED